MNRRATRVWAGLWLIVVAAAGLHVTARFLGGLNLQTDLMALLPQEDRNPVVRQAKEAMARTLAQRIVVLVGHRDAATARDAARHLQAGLEGDGVLTQAENAPAESALRALGAQYFPHRAGLLAESDRRQLLGGRAADIVLRARAQIYGFAGSADARTLQADPFLLLPSYLLQLPVPASRLTLDDGLLTVRDGNTVWALVTGQLTGDAYSIDLQERLTETLDRLVSDARGRAPDIEILRLGAVFYAADAAREAMSETSFIGTISTLGAVLLIVMVFRTASPLLLSLLAGGIGLLVGLSGCLLLFERLHVVALLFGASLIGVTVDYSLHYFGQIFTERTGARERLSHVMPGLTLGLLTTLVGYATLALAPFPGLHQIAAFSIIGLLGSFLTVVLWFPVIDGTPSAPLGGRAKRWSLALWRFWDAVQLARLRSLLTVAGLAVCVVGALRIEVSDDIRRQQDLSPTLLTEQARVQALAGFGNTSQFFVVRGATPEEVLRREEALGDRLAGAVDEGVLAGWQSAARFVPSAERQRENAALVRERLIQPHLAALRQELQMPATADGAAAMPLGLDAVMATRALPFLSSLVLDPHTHIVVLTGLTQPTSLPEIAAALDGVIFVDPTADITKLLGQYRERAVVLVVLSALLMLPLIGWRYGARSGWWVALPPVAATVATPALLALLGLPFTFFGAMALVLVLSIGFDYAVFCAEDGRHREAVTTLSVALAALTTQLSFGLLAFSRVSAIASFGATVLCGITLAFLLAPLAGRARARPMHP